MSISENPVYILASSQTRFAITFHFYEHMWLLLKQKKKVNYQELANS